MLLIFRVIPQLQSTSHFIFCLQTLQGQFIIIAIASEMQNYSYLRPSNRLIQGRTSNQFQGSGSNRFQQNFRENSFKSQQLDQLNRMRQYLKKKNSTKEIDDHLLLRYLSLNPTGGIISAVDKFNFYESWWEMPAINKNKEREILNSGVFYCYGRDNDYSPNLYFLPSLINLNLYTIEEYLVSLRTLLTPVEEHMLIKGKIDKWNVIADLRSFNESKFKSNYSIYLNNFSKICNSYPLRLKSIFLIMPGSSGIWSVVPSFSSNPNISNQIIQDLSLKQYCIKISNVKDLQRFIHADQRERKYGGTQDDLSEYWPIVSTNRLMEINSRFVEGSQDSQTYNSIANDQNAEFFGEKQENQTRCKCSIQ